mgnify:FL=1
MVKYSKKDENSFALGITLLFYLLENRKEDIKRIYLSPSFEKNETYKKIVKQAKQESIPLIENNIKIFKDLSEKDNCLAIGEFKKRFTDLDKNKNHLVLVNPSNMGNLGTILRSALAFNINNIALISPCADPYDPKTIRASMGSIFSINLQIFSSFEEYRKKYSKHYFYPFMLQAKKQINEIEIDTPYSIILGNEATGLDKSFLSIGTPTLIKISNKVDSLNLDNAASIALYEFSKSNK